MRYLLWVSLTLVYNYLMCFIAVRYNLKSFTSSYLLMTACAVIPTWSIAAYFSRNLVFDSLLYDSILVVSSVIFFAYLGQTEHFTWYNWAGAAMAVTGLVLVRA